MAAAVVDAAHDAGAVYAVAPHGWTNVAFPLAGGGLAVRGIGASTYRWMYAPAGCWCWRRSPGGVVVVAESAIDALAYVSLHEDVSAAVATCGNAGLRQAPQIVRELLPDGGVVLLAQDADDAGESQAVRLAEALTGGGIETRRHRPPEGAKDWADVAAAMTSRNWMSSVGDTARAGSAAEQQGQMPLLSGGE
ncbi:MAG: toprim domain-containing protein [Sinobacteraceae bacterium]|nr:toprim domain-containing protein [Nevskiaceae bacterium]